MTMKIGILCVGQVDRDVIQRIEESLSPIFEGFKPEIATEEVEVPEEAFNQDKRQYDADVILQKIKAYVQKQTRFDYVLGVVDVDTFAGGLNFVFGVAECPGKAALISVRRLNPEFHGQVSNRELFCQRTVKEAVHELGHTLGLQHCPNPFCVMHFSNAIVETDVKKTFFCNNCLTKAEAIVRKSGMPVE